ncbi:hypothetical protein EXS65_00505 [Candidatus Peribacteria bacterium]|nr:hypothetical protein [Candidatus Peribacteria bacterium]
MKEQRLLTIGTDAHSISEREARLIFADAEPVKTEAQKNEEIQKFSLAIHDALDDNTKKIFEKRITDEVLKDGKASKEEMKEFINDVSATVVKITGAPLVIPSDLSDANALKTIAHVSGILDLHVFRSVEMEGQKKAAEEEEKKVAEKAEQEKQKSTENVRIPFNERGGNEFKKEAMNAYESDTTDDKHEFIAQLSDLEDEASSIGARIVSLTSSSAKLTRAQRQEQKQTLSGLRQEFKAVNPRFHAYRRIFDKEIGSGMPSIAANNRQKRVKEGTATKGEAAFDTWKEKRDPNYGHETMRWGEWRRLNDEEFGQKMAAENRNAQRMAEGLDLNDSPIPRTDPKADAMLAAYKKNPKLFNMNAERQAKAERGFASIGDAGGQFSVSGGAMNSLPRYQVRGAPKKKDGSYDRNGMMDKVLGRMKEGMRDEHETGLERTAPRDIQRLFNSLPGTVQYYFRQPKGTALESKNGRIRVSANSNNDPMRIYEVYVAGGLGKYVDTTKLDFKKTKDGNHSLVLAKSYEVAATLEKLVSLYAIGIRPAPEKKIILPDKPITLFNVEGGVADLIPLSTSATARTAVLFLGSDNSEYVTFTKDATTHKWKIQDGMKFLRKYGVRVVQKREELSIEPTKEGVKLELLEKTPEGEKKTTSGGDYEPAVPAPRDEGAPAAREDVGTPSERQERDALRIVFKAEAGRLRTMTEELDKANPERDTNAWREAKAANVEEQEYLEKVDYKTIFGERSREVELYDARLKELKTKYNDKYRSAIDDVGDLEDAARQKRLDFKIGSDTSREETEEAERKATDEGGKIEDVLAAIKIEKIFLTENKPRPVGPEDLLPGLVESRLRELDKKMREWKKKLDTKKPDAKDAEPAPPPPPAEDKNPRAGEEAKPVKREVASPPKVDDKAEDDTDAKLKALVPQRELNNDFLELKIPGVNKVFSRNQKEFAETKTKIPELLKKAINLLGKDEQESLKSKYILTLDKGEKTGLQSLFLGWGIGVTHAQSPEEMRDTIRKAILESKKEEEDKKKEQEAKKGSEKDDPDHARIIKMNAEEYDRLNKKAVALPEGKLEKAGVYVAADCVLLDFPGSLNKEGGKVSHDGIPVGSLLIDTRIWKTDAVDNPYAGIQVDGPVEVKREADGGIHLIGSNDSEMKVKVSGKILEISQKIFPMKDFLKVTYQKR